MTFAKQTYYTYITVFFLLVFSYFFFFLPHDFFVAFLIAGVFYCLVFALPLFILFFKYYSLNKGLVMVYDAETGRITIKNKKLRTETAFTLDDIKYLFYTKSGSGLMAWNNYHYSEIYLENGKKFIITCLMAPQLTLPVGEKYESFTVYYPYPKGF